MSLLTLQRRKNHAIYTIEKVYFSDNKHKAGTRRKCFNDIMPSSYFYRPTFVVTKNHCTMKTLRNKFWALLLIASVAFLSCKKEDRFAPYAESSYNTKSTADVINPTSRNDWKISLYQVGEKAETNLFSQYRFIIKEDGLIQAFTNNFTENGTWSIINKSVLIHFTTSRTLSKLNNEWRITTKTENEIKLQHLTRKGEIMFLNFQRFKRSVETPIETEVPVGLEPQPTEDGPSPL